MHVLMIGMDYSLLLPEGAVGGNTHERMREYAKSLDYLHIVIYTFWKQRLKHTKISDKIKVYSTNSMNSLFFIIDGYNIVKRILEKNKIEVITTQDPLLTGLLGFLVSYKYRIPLNVQIHGDYLDNKEWYKESLKYRFLDHLGRYVLKRCDTVRVVSSRLEKRIRDRFSMPSEKIFSFPIFMDTKRFTNYHPTGFIKMRHSRRNNIVLFVGRLVKTKNVPLLLRAWKDVVRHSPESLLLIVGDGEEKSYLEEMVCRLGLKGNVSFEGLVDYDLLPEYYYACDMLVLPSNYEGWSLVVLEALLCAKPVIMTEVGCAGEIVIDGENGFVIPIGNEDALVEKIIYLIENKNVAVEMGKKGKRLVEKTQDLYRNSYRYFELYQKTIELANKGR